MFFGSFQTTPATYNTAPQPTAHKNEAAENRQISHFGALSLNIRSDELAFMGNDASDAVVDSTNHFFPPQSKPFFIHGHAFERIYKVPSKGLRTLN